MNYDPAIHHRRSIRLKNYDYAATGAYYVTVCAQGRACLFGEVVNGAIVMNEAGRMVEKVWDGLSTYSGVFAADYVVMPNHVHGIIMLNVGAAPRGRPDVDVGTDHGGLTQHKGYPLGEGHPQGGAPTMSLFDVVHRFKSLTTARYRHGVNQCSWPPFPGRLWQRNYFERIIRDDAELAIIREYIQGNPMRWEEAEQYSP